MPAYSYKDDELLARQLMEEDMRANNDMIYAQKLQEEEERSRRDIFERDVEIARQFESDAEAARLQAERVAAEERRLLEDSEFARKIAEAGKNFILDRKPSLCYLMINPRNIPLCCLYG